MKLKYLFFVSLIAMFMTSCETETGTTISGIVKNAADLDVKLDKLKLDNNTMVLVSSKTDANGEFKVNIPDGLKEGVYRLRVGNKGISFILAGNESNVQIDGDFSDFERYNVSVKGSEVASSYTSILNKVASRQAGIPEIQAYVDGNNHPLASMFLLTQTMGQSSSSLPFHQKVYNSLSTSNPQSEYVKEYAAFIAKAKQIIAQKAAKEKIKVGQPAPEIALKSPQGKMYKLSDLKGKIVLLDFWASWCGPCRKANPHVVSVYEKYNKKGFEVFSVSLDGLDERTKARLNGQDQIDKMMVNSKNKWKAAIKADNLKWPYHVSDLKKWNSIASGTYGVSSIPKTFLIGRDGNIAAVNPRNNLEEVVLAELAKD